MPRKKAPIFHALNPAHLQAIGRVTAEWSKLEFTIQMLISEVADIDLYKTIILTRKSNIRGWMDMLKNTMWHVYADNAADKELEILFTKTIEQLSKERNEIVHSLWLPQTKQKGKQDGLSVYGPVPATSAGLSFPRGGKKLKIDVNKTAKEMRDVAKKIHAAQDSLYTLVRLTHMQHKVKVANEAATPRRINVNALSPD